MRFLILADIHGNLTALETVLRDVERDGSFDKIWCLGDIVGYGPQPHDCLALRRQYPLTCLAGNHDWAAAGKINTSDFNPEAAWACQWTAKQLNKEDVACLMNLPLSIHEGSFTLVHGSPREPIWEYLLSIEAARDNFAYFSTPFCLIGHSHVPLIFRQLEENKRIVFESLGDQLVLDSGDRLIINPGGVGQPRDGDPRASYALYDTDDGAIHHRRVEYDIPRVQKMMAEQGLPRMLIQRLSYGR